MRAGQLAYRAYRARKLVNVLRYTDSAMHDERYFQRSGSMLRMVMESDPVRDPGGMRGAVCFNAGGTCGSARQGAYRLVVHPRTRRIVHFGFER